ncbi:MAG: hypothetical protein QOG63_1442 [Thermoleophilaceae bacterium]|jgi:hypothetical protein|nr:hypothetical protein [Thermoleophilaceae bacterium]
MLKILEQETIEGVTVFADDTYAHVFYALPSNPRFRIDDSGRPSFKFLKYRAPIERDDGFKGGGFCFFDVEFTVPDDKATKIKEVKQEQLNQAWRGQAPPVELGNIVYTRGTSGLLLTDSSGKLVQAVKGAGKPSLYGKNISAFEIEFTPEGATLFEQALQGHGGVVQVVYDMYFWVRLPPLTAHSYFHGEASYTFYQTIDVDWNMWGDDSYRETVEEQFHQREYSGVDLEFGFALPDEEENRKLKDQIRSNMQRNLEAAVQRLVLKQADPVPPDDRKLPEDVEHVTRDESVFKSADFDEYYTESGTMEWNVVPQGTLPNITSLTTPDGPVKWSDYSAMVDLDDPFFKQLRVNVHANVDFDALPVFSVDVHLEYKEGSTTRIEDFSFQKPDDVGKFESYIENDVWTYTYSYTVNYEHASGTLKKGPIKTDTRELTINVDDLGVLDVNVQAGDINWDQVRQVQGTLEYEARDVPKISEQFELDKDHHDHRITKPILQSREQPYRYRLTYFTTAGQEVPVDWQEGDARDLFLNDPFKEDKRISVRAAGDLVNKIDTIFVDLVYDDPKHQFHQTASIALSQALGFYEWKFPTMGAGTDGTLTYSGAIRYRNGTIEEIPATVAKSNTIVVGDIVEDRLHVEVLADLIDFAQVKLVKVTLHYVDAENHVDQSHDIVFKNGAATTGAWDFDLKEKTHKSYSWTAQFFMASGGAPLTVGPTTTSEGTVVLQAPAAAPA